MTYEELDEAIDRSAQGLVNLGVKKGDRVALYMENCPQFLISFFGIHRAGGVAVPFNPMFKHAELEYELNDAQAEILVGLDFLHQEVERIRDRVPSRNAILTSLGDYLPDEPVLPLPSEAREPKLTFHETVHFFELLNESPHWPTCNGSAMKDDLALFAIYRRNHWAFKRSHDYLL
jgi:long-chain acyl-CoA synthetase